MKRNPTFVDLFCGAGGLSHGAIAAGWRCVLAVDCWADALRTYAHNFPGHVTRQADVSELTPSLLAKLLGGDVDWVVGGLLDDWEKRAL